MELSNTLKDILSCSSSEFIYFNRGVFERVFITRAQPFSNFYNLNHLKRQLITSATSLLAESPTILSIVSCQMSKHLTDTEMLVVKDSKIQPSAKSAGALLSAVFICQRWEKYPSNEVEDLSFYVWWQNL